VPAIKSRYTAEQVSLSHSSKWQNGQRSPRAGLAPDFCSQFHEPPSAPEQTCMARAGPLWAKERSGGAAKGAVVQS